MPLTRRNFVQRLSLGAGLPVLAPILGQLEREAYGVEGSRPRPQRFVFVA